MGARYKINFGVEGIRKTVQGINEIRAASQKRREAQERLDALAGRSKAGDAIKALVARTKELVRQLPGGNAIVGVFEKIGLKAGLAAAAVAAVGAAMFKTVRRSQELADLASKVGVSTVRLQALEFAAKSLGFEFATLQRVIADLRERQAQALRGSAELQAAFTALGVTMADLQSKSPDQLLLMISQRLRDGTASAADFEAVIRTMGESGKELFAALQKDIAGLVTEFESSGAAMSAAYTQSFAGIGDFWDVTLGRMQSRAGGFFNAMKTGFFELGDDFAKGIALLTGNGGALTELQAAEILRKDPDYAQGQANLERQRARLGGGQGGSGPAAEGFTGDDRESNRAASILKLEAELARIKMAGLEPEKKRLAMVEQAKRLEREIAILRDEDNGDGSLRADILKKQIALAKVNQQIEQAQASRAEKANADSLTKIGLFRSGDAIARIGGSVGSSSAAARDQRKDIRELTRIAREQSRALDEIRRNTGALR